MRPHQWGIRHPDGTVEKCPDKKAAEFAALFPIKPGGKPEVVREIRGVWVPADQKDPMRPAIDRALDGDHRLCGIDPCSDCR